MSTFPKRKREDIVIKRTKGGKPFLAMKRTEDENRDLPNFNFNVAHDGDWVISVRGTRFAFAAWTCAADKVPETELQFVNGSSCLRIISVMKNGIGFVVMITIRNETERSALGVSLALVLQGSVYQGERRRIGMSIEKMYVSKT